MSDDDTEMSNYPDDTLPPNLPRPRDEGSCDHLRHRQKLASVQLPATSGEYIDLASLPGLSVVFCFPRTGMPGEGLPKTWDALPGARGCTPQACSFRDNARALINLGVTSIFGLSTQDTEQQSEAKSRLHLPYALLSDHGCVFAEKVRLPVFVWGDIKLLKRVTLLVNDGEVVWVHYPVFPPDKSADAVIEYLESEDWQREAAEHLSRKGIRRCGNE